MNNKKLLASVALFSQLYNSDKYSGIAEIIAEFIIGAIVLHNKYSLTSYELKTILEETYEFSIPESVIKTVIHSKLKGIFEVENKVYKFDSEIKSNFDNVDKELEKRNELTESIFKGLKKHISEIENKELSGSEVLEIFENFNQFLFENGTSDNYSDHISSYIIKNETDTDFVTNLNEIREGLILYHGIRYTADINELGKWKTNLVIYLNTEYLFSAIEYNGLLYKEIFDDFYNLVQEINNDGKKISLKYFPETMAEIDEFFASAEAIVKGEKKLMPWKTAMKKIVDSCKTPSEIISFKADFYSKLEKLDIELQEFDFENEEYAEYNVVDENIIKKLKSVSKEKKKRFDEESCYYFLNIFTKVNFFRQGNNRKSFSKIGHIFISDSGFAKYLGHNNSVKFEDFDTTFAKDIDFVTTQFWIKLKKGFSEKSPLPKSFNVLTKAKIIISSHINSSMTKEFDKLVKDTDSGKLTKEEALARSYALREKPNLPIEITSENIDETFDFLNNENYLADIYQEQLKKDELIKKAKEQNLELQKEIERRDKVDKEREEKEKREREVKENEDKRKRYNDEIQKYNKKMKKFCETEWSYIFKKLKSPTWKYLIFILIALVIIITLVSFRNSILGLLTIPMTEESKLYYSGIIMAVGFIATTIRSFFDTKNILLGLKLFTCKRFRGNYKETHVKELEKQFESNNKKPKLEENPVANNV